MLNAMGTASQRAIFFACRNLIRSTWGRLFYRIGYESRLCRLGHFSRRKTELGRNACHSQLAARLFDIGRLDVAFGRNGYPLHRHARRAERRILRHNLAVRR